MLPLRSQKVPILARCSAVTLEGDVQSLANVLARKSSSPPNRRSAIPCRVPHHAGGVYLDPVGACGNFPPQGSSLRFLAFGVYPDVSCRGTPVDSTGASALIRTISTFLVPLHLPVNPFFSSPSSRQPLRSLYRTIRTYNLFVPSICAATSF